MSAAQPLPMAKMGHVAPLDGVRGIAIGLVFGVHLYAPLFPGGNSGVDLFFVLSGFLITKLAYEEHDRTAAFSRRAFYRRRFFRILPALLVLVAVVLIGSFSFISDVGSAARRESLFATLSIGNLWPLFYGAADRPMLGHTWSLGIEEQFYFVWPIVLAYVPIVFSAPRRFAMWVGGVTIASILIGRLVVIGAFDYPHWGSIPLLDFDGLAIGCLVAIALHTGAFRWVARVPEWAGWVVLALTAFDLAVADPDADRFGLRRLILRALFAILVIVVLLHQRGRLGAILRWSPLRFLGRISYSLYLWHVPMFAMFSNDRFPDQPRWFMFGVRAVAAFAAALISYYAIEQPVLRWFRSWNKRQEALVT